MHRREFLLFLNGITAAASTSMMAAPAAAANMPLPLNQVEALANVDAEYSFLIGRLTHRRRAGWWWRRRVAAARRWGRRGRPGRR